MKYILHVDIAGLTVDLFKRTTYKIRELKRGAIPEASELKNITQCHLSTSILNKILHCNFQVIDFTNCLDIGDEVYLIDSRQDQIRYYRIEIVGDVEKVIRRPELRYIDDMIEKCNAYTSQFHKMSENNREIKNTYKQDRSAYAPHYENRRGYYGNKNGRV